MVRAVRSVVAVALGLVLALAGCGAAAGPDLSAHTALTSVAMSSATDGWAVGEYGTILRYAGGAWRPFPAPTHADLYGVASLSASEAWAVGLDVAAGHGILLHFADGQWEQVRGLSVPALRSVILVSPVEGWAVGDGGTILHLTSGQWHALPSITRYPLYAVAIGPSGDGWAVGYGMHNTSDGSVDTGAILRYHAGQWSNTDHSADPATSTYARLRLYGVAIASNGEAWAVGLSGLRRGLVLHNSGGPWDLANGFGPYQLMDVRVASPADSWAAGYNGTLLHYDGVRWKAASSPTKTDLAALAMVGPDEGWAVGDDHLILHMHNGIWSVYQP
jgi:photosystem II stability/assembly factor-like uncharacterized protein